MPSSHWPVDPAVRGERAVSGEADAVIATWVTSTDCGARYETLHADGQVHVDVQPPIGEPEFDGQDDPDHNPVCNCPRAPRSWCDRCAGVL